MATIKKLLLSVLIVFTFTTSICYIKPEEINAEVDLYAVPYNDVMKILENYDKYTNSKFSKAMSGMATVGGIAGAVKGAFNAVMSALKMFGVIPDAAAEFKVNTLNRLEAISYGLDEANLHIDNIMSTLTTEFANLNLANRTNIIVADRTNIQSFKENHENVMESFLSEFPIIIKGKLRNFYYKTPNELNYNTVAYVDESVDSNKIEAVNIKFTKDQFKQAKQGISYSATNTEQVFIDIFKNLFNNINPKTYVDNYDIDTFVNSGICDWIRKALQLSEDATKEYVRNYYTATLTNENRNVLIEKFARQLYDAVGTQFLVDLANEDLGTSDSYIASLLNSFENFYNALISSNNPLSSQYSIFKNTWVFQGDCFYIYYIYRNKENGQVISTSQYDKLLPREQSNYVVERIEGNSLLDARDYYISLATKYSIFVQTMLSVVSNETYRSKAKDIKDKYDKIAESLSKIYNNNIITENDNILRNYCYVTKCPLQFEYIDVYGEMDTKHWLKTNFDLDASDGYTVSNWKGSYSKSEIVDDVNANIIYKLYVAHGYKPTYSFDNYLIKNGINIPSNIHSILTNEVYTENFSSVPRSSMYVWETTDKDKNEYWGTASSNHTLVEASHEMPFTARKVESQYFKDMKQAVANGLDFSSGNISKQVLSKYFVYEEKISAKSDAMDMFWLGTYDNNKTARYSEYTSLSTETIDNTRVTKNTVKIDIDDLYGALFKKQIKQPTLLMSTNSISNNSIYDYSKYVDIENLTREFNAKLVKAINTEKIKQNVNPDKLINYQYDSSYGDVPYWVSFASDYFDGTKQENEELFDKFVDYLQDEETIKTLAKEYVDYEKRLLENTNVSEDYLKINVSNNKLKSLANIINNQTAIIVDNESKLPSPSSDNAYTLYYCVKEKAYAINNGSSWKIKTVNDISEYLYYDYKTGNICDAYIVDDINNETLSSGRIYYDKNTNTLYDANKNVVFNYLIETNTKPEMPDTTKVYVDENKYYIWSGKEYIEDNSVINTSGSLPQLDDSMYLVNGDSKPYVPYVWSSNDKAYKKDTNIEFKIDENGAYYYEKGDRKIYIDDIDSEYLFIGDTQIHNVIVEVDNLENINPTKQLDSGSYLVVNNKYYLIDNVDEVKDLSNPELGINNKYAYYVASEKCYYIHGFRWQKVNKYEVVNINPHKNNIVYFNKADNKYYRYDGNEPLTVINVVNSIEYLPSPEHNNLIYLVGDKYYEYSSSALGYIKSNNVINGLADIPNIFALYRINNTNTYYEYSNGEFVLVDVHGDEVGEKEDYLYAYNNGIYYKDGSYSVYYDGVFAPIGLIYVGKVVELPVNADDMELSYRYNFNMLYELEIKRGKIGHKAYPVYDVVPSLTYKVDGVSYTIDVTDEQIQKAGIKSKIRIPVLDDVSLGYSCLIEHYKSVRLNDLMEDPETFNKVIKGTQNNKYVELEVSSFSPFVMKEYKKIANEIVPHIIEKIIDIGIDIEQGKPETPPISPSEKEEDKKKESYIIPKTGVER